LKSGKRYAAYTDDGDGETRDGESVKIEKFVVAFYLGFAYNGIEPMYRW
jgi:hypothetical protein